MNAKTGIYRGLFLGCMAFVFLLLAASKTFSAVGACSTVKMQILQELTLERIAFDAQMVITNNVPDQDLSSVRVDVSIKDNDGNAKDSLFFVKVTSLQNIAGVDGSGIVKAATASEIHWLIIPSPGAGGAVSSGTLYWVGATLTYTVSGQQQTITVNPARIIVKPEAQLILDYFTPYEVLGDNPFTPQVEAPVPFPLAVRVLNSGYGPAVNLKIDSAQPRIVENKQGLLVDFKLLGSSVNDGVVAPSLSASLGTLDSKKIATASWEMIATLSGYIKEFAATFSHASELGGELTSLIKETNTHYLTHRVKVNLPGRDNRLDYLATMTTNTTSNPDLMPDSIFESEIPGNTGETKDSRSLVSVVQVVTPPARPTPSAPEVLVSLQTGTTGWVYARTSDPAQGMLTLLDVVRADGVHLDPNNFWIQEGLDKNYKQIFTLNLLDYRADASAPGTYRLVYTQPADDTIPPSTRLVFDGPATGTDPVYYLTPATRIILLSTDNDGGSGVDQMFRKLAGKDDDFIPALPFSIPQPGTYTLEYYSVDRDGNAEVTKTATLIVDSAPPEVLTFRAIPSTITPLAPRGLAADRTTSFTVKATDDQPGLPATIDIAKGSTFAPTAVIRTLKTTLASGTETSVPWDGKDAVGILVPTGSYTARLSVTDGLDSSPTTSHTATSEIPLTVADWFTGQPLDPASTGEQQHPGISGTLVVWQDNRSGAWQIYTKETGTAGSASRAVTSGASDHIYPAVDGSIIVWQDSRNGAWDIYGYDLSQQQEFVICNDAGNQERPVVAGAWVAWQDDRNGNWDIYAYNLSTHAQVRVTNHVRDQLHPAIANGALSWEDYRHGLGEIYAYDLASGTETRYTVDINNQTLPALSGGAFVWTDQRNNQRDIYYSPAQNTEIRVTYGSGDHSQAAILGEVIVYTDYEAGTGDPNLSFYDARSGLGALLTANPARQEEPALGSDVLVWQDDRDGAGRIYWSPFKVEAVPISAEVKAGLNLIAVGDKLAKAYPATSDLIAAAPNGITIEKIVGYDSRTGTFMDTSAGADIALQKGMAIGLYAAAGGTLDIADSGETGRYTLLPGQNYVGMLAVPNGYTAYSLLESLGFANVQSVRRFSSETGLWESASVRDAAGAQSAAGVNFVLRQGDGVIIVMKSRVDGWTP